MRSIPYNPVLIFKQEGEPQSNAMDNLANDDFLLALQTEFQKDTRKQYGDKCILTNTTHCTTQYDFQLISIFVIDDHGAGLPVAQAISNKDTTLLVHFLKAVHACIGDFKPCYFIVRFPEQYFKAWCCVFGAHKTCKLLCICHVDRAWAEST